MQRNCHHKRPGTKPSLVQQQRYRSVDVQVRTKDIAGAGVRKWICKQKIYLIPKTTCVPSSLVTNNR
jgi:hypothetical protein